MSIFLELLDQAKNLKILLFRFFGLQFAVYVNIIYRLKKYGNTSTKYPSSKHAESSNVEHQDRDVGNAE